VLGHDWAELSLTLVERVILYPQRIRIDVIVPGRTQFVFPFGAYAGVSLGPTFIKQRKLFCPRTWAKIRQENRKREIRFELLPVLAM
jgi:hypothetical protein